MSRPLIQKALALVGVAALMLAQFRARAQRPDFSDFKVYWLAGAKAIAHHTVYDVEGHYQYKYSPFIALLWGVPHLLGGSRYFWALAHYAACAAGFLALWYACARVLDRERGFWLWLIALVTCSVGLRDELKLGQANLWPLLLVIPAWLSGPAARKPGSWDLPGLAIGAAWGFAIQWKLYALVLAPVWLLRRRGAVFLGCVVFTVLSLWGALWLTHGSSFALHENVRWLQSLSASSQDLLVSKYNVSALGSFGKWAEHAGLAFGAWAYALWLPLAIGWGLVLVWAERGAPVRDVSYRYFWSAAWAWAGIVILNPLVWPYWLTFCVPLYLAYVHEFGLVPRRRPDAMWLLVVACFALANWLQNTIIVHEGASFVAVCLLLFDAQRRARQRAVEPQRHSSELRSDVMPTSRSI